MGGIDTYCDTIISVLISLDIEVRVAIMSKNKSQYLKKFYSGHVEYLIDDTHDRFAWLSLNNFFVNKIINKILNLFDISILYPCKRWAKRQVADLVIYPYHLGEVQFTAESISFIHSFLPDYSNEHIRLINAHVKTSYSLITCWPAPYHDYCNKYPDYLHKFKLLPLTTYNRSLGMRLYALPESFSRGYFLYPAVISHRKNHQYIVDTYVQAQENSNELRPIIFCGGGDKECTEALMSKIDKYNLQEKILLTGYVSDEELNYLYENSTAVISASSWEAGMIAIQEGLYFGKPVICSRILPAIEHAKLVNYTPLFFSLDDPAGLIKALVEFDLEKDNFTIAAEKRKSFIKNDMVQKFQSELRSLITKDYYDSAV